MEYSFHDKLHLTADVTVHALILFVFLSIFFTFYVSKMTTTEMNNQIGGLIDTNLTNVLEEANQDYGMNFSSTLQTLPLETLSESYNKPSLLQTTSNSWLNRDLLICNIALFVIVAGSMVLVKKICGLDLDVKEVLKLNAFIFTFIGIVEYMFFTKVALKYIPAPPSLMITSIITNIQSFFLNK